MGVKTVIFIALLSAATFLLYSKIFAPLKLEPYQLQGSQYFGTGKPRDDDPKVMAFKIRVSDVVLQDLKDRLKSARIGHKQLEDVKDFQYGFNLATLLKYRDYWLNKYDWRKYEEILNGFPQFTTQIDGLKIHFLHVKPPANKYKKVIPLLLVHGWPGNVFEFYKIIPLLTDPNGAYKDSKNKFEFAFEVVAPSIPGYGWSEQPHKTGFSQTASARIFNTLMTQRLNFSKYLAQGGDWGSLNVLSLGRLFPQNLLGVHTNTAFGSFDTPRDLLRILVGSVAPNLVYSSPLSANYSFINSVWVMLKESGYFHIQATRPDTVGVGLNDSPIGLLAYVGEKFSAWTNREFLLKEDGGLERKFTKDELLTIITIYWVNSNILSSQRYYRESFSDPLIKELEKHYITVPTGIASFPYDLIDRSPIEFFTWRYNVTHYTEFDDGGHFAAFEMPNELAYDILKFAKTLQF